MKIQLAILEKAWFTRKEIYGSRIMAETDR
jgi:hypothetical protein